MLFNPFSRRAFLKTTSSGFGYVAFAGLATAQAQRERPAAAGPLAPKTPHFPPKARRVIFLCMEGGPSHVDSFDYKPRLIRDAGRTMPAGRGRFGGTILAPQWTFRQRGKSGLWISDLF